MSKKMGYNSNRITYFQKYCQVELIFFIVAI